MKKRFLAALVAALPIALLQTPATAADSATVEIVSLAGAGAHATFDYTAGTGRWCVDTVLEVNASTARQLEPAGAPTTTPHMEVSLTQTRCGSGKVVFAGQGSLDNPDVAVAGSLTTAELHADVTADAATGGATRTVAVDVRWALDGAPERIVRNESVSVPGFVVNTHHDGAVARASATATITVTDPTTDTDPITVHTDTTKAALWDTSNKRITATAAPGATTEDTDAATPSTSTATTSTSTTTTTTTSLTTSTSYWTGYWVWTWDATSQSWKATWIWVWVRG